MAASRSQAQVHQDYIARIRYTNGLPPPPNPPKLQSAPGHGVDQYNAPGFAAKLAREQPLNIEIDGELGMEIDLLGIPGIFEGDEKWISAQDPLPVAHPKDRILLRTLNQIEKPEIADSKLNFLLTDKKDHHGNMKPQAARRDTLSRSTPVKRTAVGAPKIFDVPGNLDKDSPEYFKAIIKNTFDITRDNLAKNPADIKHPTKRGVTCVSSVPILPDFDAMTDMGGYLTIKYANNPVPRSNKYDVRLDAALLSGNETDQNRLLAYHDQLERHMVNPDLYPMPAPLQDFHLYIPDTVDDAAGLKAKSNAVVNGQEEGDDDSFYTTTDGDGKRVFKYKHVREYETAQMEKTGLKDAWSKEVALVVRDGDDAQPHGAFIYPIIAKYTIRPMRSKNISKLQQKRHGQDEQSDIIPTMYLSLGKLTEEEKEEKDRFKFKDDPLGVFVDVRDAAEAEALALQQQQEREARKAGNGADVDMKDDGDDDADADADADADGEPDDVEMGM